MTAFRSVFPSFFEMTGENPPQTIVNVGARDIDGAPAYAPLLSRSDARIVGFEPARDALEKLLASKRPKDIYLPYAIGDGERRPLHVCHAPGMTSLLTPNQEVLQLFHGFPSWGRVVATEWVDTVRLDDIPETEGVTLLQMDIQGAELMALRHAENRLREALVLHIEVEFAPLYENQPLFSDVEMFLRERGFVFHRFAALASRVIAPLTMNGDIFAGLSQAVWGDAVFVRDFTRLSAVSDERLLAFAAILHECYRSVDLALFILRDHDRRRGGRLEAAYLAGLRKNIGPAIGLA